MNGWWWCDTNDGWRDDVDVLAWNIDWWYTLTTYIDWEIKVDGTTLTDDNKSMIVLDDDDDMCCECRHVILLTVKRSKFYFYSCFYLSWDHSHYHCHPHCQVSQYHQSWMRLNLTIHLSINQSSASLLVIDHTILAGYN